MPARLPPLPQDHPSRAGRIAPLLWQPWRWFDLRLPEGETELNAFNGIFSGLVITESHVVIAKFLRGSKWLPYGSIRGVRGGWFADKPDSEEIRLWGIELHTEDAHYTVGVWNWGPACEIIERAMATAESAPRVDRADEEPALLRQEGGSARLAEAEQALAVGDMRRALTLLWEEDFAASGRGDKVTLGRIADLAEEIVRASAGTGRRERKLRDEAKRLSETASASAASRESRPANRPE